MSTVELQPMSTAPRDGTEILAYHRAGNFHPVSHHTWKEGGLTYWGMRWCREYRQYDGDFKGWVPMPEVSP